MDWKSIVRATAPILGTALGGPLAGAAVKVLGQAILGTDEATQDDVSAALVQGLSPDAIAKLKEADITFKTRMRELDIDVLKLNAATEQAYLSDVQDARKAGLGNENIFWLGLAVICAFILIMGGVLWGAFMLLHGAMQGVDPGIAAAVFTMIGSVVGYASANAQQVLGYYFGSSKGSADKTKALTDALEDVGRQVK